MKYDSPLAVYTLAMLSYFQSHVPVGCMQQTAALHHNHSHRITARFPEYLQYIMLSLLPCDCVNQPAPLHHSPFTEALQEVACCGRW